MNYTFITNACLITNDNRQVFQNGYIAIKGGKIESVGDMSELPESVAEASMIDAGGRIVMPGFINAHAHLYSQMARGIPVPKMRSFFEILDMFWWRFDNVLTEEDVYYSALLGLVEAIKSGVTTVIDHHASYNYIKGSLITIEKAFIETGMRGALCFEISDRLGKKHTQAAIHENVHFIQHVDKMSKDKDYLLRALCGLHASFTVSDETLKDIRAAMGNENIGFHVHVAEGPEDLKDSLDRYSKSVVRRLSDAGILNEGSVAAHCVHIDDADMQILKENKCWVVHNPTSNMNNAVGWMPFLKLHSMGVPVALGTDGMSNSLFSDMRATSLIHRAAAEDPTVGWTEANRSVMDINPALASSMFGVDIGYLKKGAAADVVITDVVPYTEVNSNNFWAHILFGVTGGRVRTTIVNGQILMEDFEVKVLNEALIAERARSLATDLWRRFLDPKNEFKYRGE